MLQLDKDLRLRDAHCGYCVADAGHDTGRPAPESLVFHADKNPLSNTHVVNNVAEARELYKRAKSQQLLTWLAYGAVVCVVFFLCVQLSMFFVFFGGVIGFVLGDRLLNLVDGTMQDNSGNVFYNKEGYIITADGTQVVLSE